QAYCAAHGDRLLRAASLFRPEQSQRKPAQIEKIANHSHENETPEPFFEGLCFQCRSHGRESHGELRGGLLFGSGGGVLASRPNSSSLPIIVVIAPELNRVFTVAGPTLARRPASGAAFDGIVEARCNQNSTIGPLHLRWCGETIRLSPWQQSRKQVN